MVGLMRHILCGDLLSPSRRALLLDWLRACRTGAGRLRAGSPPDWVVGHKTGSGAEGDVAIATPPGRAPLLVAVYASDGTAEPAALDAAHAEVARLVAREL